MGLFSFGKSHKNAVNTELKDQEEIEIFLHQNVRHFLPSYILSQDDEFYKPNERLIEIGLEAAKRAFSIDLTIHSRAFHPELQRYINTYPGEHYRLLAALTEIIKPTTAIEIGTYQGAGCMAIKSHLPEGSKLFTFDIIPFDKIENSGLFPSDFDDKMEQRIVDLSDPLQAESQISILEKADFIFVDAAKDGHMERAFISLFDRIKFKRKPIIMFDDIRFTVMTPIWREIKHPKLDISSFGHWSGSGLVEWI